MSSADLVEVEKLRQLERLLEDIIPQSDDKIILQMIGFGAAISFLTFVLKMTYKIVKKGKIDIKENVNDILTLIVTVSLFCTPLYCGLVLILNSFNGILEEIFSKHFHHLMFQMAYMYSQISESINGGFSIFNPNIFSAPTDILISSFVYYSTIIAAYVVRSIPDFFYSTVIITGPIIAGFTPLSREFIKKWINLLVASVFCVFFFDLILVVLTITDAFLLLSEVLKDNMVMGLIIIGLTLSSFIGIGIDIVGHMFGVNMIFGIAKLLTPYGMVIAIANLVLWLKNPNPNKLLQGLKGKPRKA